MKTPLPYIYLCVPVEGNAKMLDGNELHEIIMMGRYDGLIIGHWVKDDIINMIYDFVDGVAQNRYTIYGRNGNLHTDGFYRKVGNLSRMEGELLDFYPRDIPN